MHFGLRQSGTDGKMMRFTRNLSLMSTRGQDATSGEGSPMAKPKLLVPAKARPLNLVSRSPWSGRNSSHNLGYLVNPENADERKGENEWK